VENSGGIQASLAGRYARALFDLAVERDALREVESSLATLKAALAESSDFRLLVNNPLLSRRAASAAIAAISKELGSDPLTNNFLAVLAGNARLDQLHVVIEAFESLARSHRGEVTAHVTTAHPLDSGQAEALAAKLKARVGMDVAIDATINPDILGGLIVKIGSQMIDGSIATKLNTLALAMKG